MKLEIKKEFSTNFMTDRFWVYVNEVPKGSHETFEIALGEIEKLKIALEKSYPPELVYSEEF